MHRNSLIGTILGTGLGGACQISHKFALCASYVPPVSDLVQMLEDAPSEAYDVVVISIGANDLTSLMPPKVWLQWQNSLALVVRRRFRPSMLIHIAVPPMHACAALPQPLRWFMGRWAKEMNCKLSWSLKDQQDQRTLHWHPKTTVTHGMAHDGLHPGPKGYAMWAQELSERIFGESKSPPLIA